MNRSEFMMKWATLDAKVKKLDEISTEDDFVDWVTATEKASADVTNMLTALHLKVSDYDRCKSTLEGQKKKVKAVKVSFMYVEPEETDGDDEPTSDTTDTGSQGQTGTGTEPAGSDDTNSNGTAEESGGGTT